MGLHLRVGVDYNGHVGYVASWNLPPKGAFDMTSINCTPRKYKLPITSGYKCADTLSVASESCIGVYGAKSLLCAVRGDLYEPTRLLI